MYGVPKLLSVLATARLTCAWPAAGALREIVSRPDIEASMAPHDTWGVASESSAARRIPALIASILPLECAA